MSPLRSSLSRSATKLLGVFRKRDLTIRGLIDTDRRGFVVTGGTVILDKPSQTAICILTSNDTLLISGSYSNYNLLLVGGGGSGNYHGPTTGSSDHNATGGGGAGGMIVKTSQTDLVSGISYAAVIGAGGVQLGTGNPAGPGYDRNSPLRQGNPSTFNGLTALGGGAGAFGQATGSPGGSGGGAGNGGYNDDYDVGGTGNQPGNPSGGLGNDGGDGYAAGGNDTRYSGGGGGAGGDGGNAPGSAGGVGSGIDWIPSSYGTPGPNGSLRYFAGGGGGAPQQQSTGGAGGYGGGGVANTDRSNPATPGTANTGGGGGAKTAYNNGTVPNSLYSGGGGSGILAVKFFGCAFG